MRVVKIGGGFYETFQLLLNVRDGSHKVTCLNCRRRFIQIGLDEYMIRYQTKITLAEIVKMYYFGIMIGIIIDYK